MSRPPKAGVPAPLLAASALGFALALSLAGCGGSSAPVPGPTGSAVPQAEPGVWTWGANDFGQLGDGGTTASSVPVRVQGITGQAVALAGGVEARYALLADGSVWAWGEGDRGELGTGTDAGSFVAVQIKGLTHVMAVAGGGGDGYALLADGTVRAWGNGAGGELGDGRTPDHADRPVAVSGLTGVTAIAGGGGDGYALRSDGTVWAWGQNDRGALGDGATADSSVPVRVSGLTKVVAVAAGPVAGDAYALRADGTVWAWGDDQHGGLGDGAATPANGCGCSRVPVRVAGLTGVIQIAGEYENGFALGRDGTVWAWGGDAENILAGAASSRSDTPVRVSGLGRVTTLVTGDGSAYALRADGAVLAWGAAESGALGDGSTAPSARPVQVSGLNGVAAIGDGSAIVR